MDMESLYIKMVFISKVISRMIVLMEKVFYIMDPIVLHIQEIGLITNFMAKVFYTMNFP
jgi:hypothetical protein